MGLLTDADWAAMAADLAEVRGDNEIEVILRRGDTTLPAQPVRVARQGSFSQQRDSDGGQAVRGRVVVLGGTDFDVQAGDRFNDGAGVLYEVSFVRPNRRAAVVAEAEAVE